MSQAAVSPLLLRSLTPVHGSALDVGTINVLVGPNNVGKSEALRDLVRLVGNFEPTGADTSAGEEPVTRVFQDVAFVPKLSLERLLYGVSGDGAAGEATMASGIGPDLKTPYRRAVASELKNILYRPMITARSVRSTALGVIMPLRVAYLPAEQRTRLIEPTAAASPIQAPANLLQALQFAEGQVAEQFDAAMVQLCHGHHVRLDSTERVNLCLRVAPSIPPLTGNAVRDVNAYSALPLLDQQGDGWKSCAAVVLTFLVCPGRVIVLDQPEAYLQAGQARELGLWIAQNALRLGTQVFVATRDAAFLSGLFAGGADVSILRLSRRMGDTRVELVPPEVGKALAVFPLFAAQNAIQCLFQDGVVVASEESARIVYATVAARQLKVSNVGFLQAQGGRNLAFVARLLRRANLPTCVIAELDLFQAEQGFAELVKAMSQQDPPAPWIATRERLASHVEGWFDEQELSSSASEVESFLDQLKKGDAAATEMQTPRLAPSNAKSKWDRLRREKLSILPRELRVWVEELLDELKRIGIFVSPKGRLQGWLEHPGIEDPDLWFNRTIQALDRGECPAELRAFVAETTAFVQASTGASRPAHSGHSA